MIGRELSHYRIVEKLGEGGMGEVYLAEDTKLDRKVALKVLPPELAASAERRARFEREAKAVAALNHPNIVTVYSVEEADGVHFITMERVKGKPLAEILPKKGFALDRFFALAIPLADAVAAAHQEGITHRDLKPDNVMVTGEGRVKVLDFGLARSVKGFAGAGSSELPTQAKTVEGAIVGTLTYMSPEQAQGKSVDARSDVSSLGVVLFEMLTGRRPFQGETPAEVLSSIIKGAAPAPAEVRSEIPRRLSKTVERCIAKDPLERYQSVIDLRHDLDEIREEAQAVRDAGREERQRSWKWAGPALVAIFGLAAVLTLVDRLPSRVERALPRLTNPVQITSATGVEDYPAWSPDGRTLAYTGTPGRESGNGDIWVTQVERGQPVNRTVDYEGVDCCPSWSPDANEIAFWSDRDGAGYFVMSALGGPARKILSTPPNFSQFNAPQWSADGKELAGVVVRSTDVLLQVYSMDARTTREVSLPGSLSARNHLSWSRDGRFIAVVDGGYYRDNHRLWLMRLTDGTSFGVTDGLTKVLSPSFASDGRHLYYVSNRGGSMDLWDQRLDSSGRPEGDPTPLTVGVGMLSAAFSLDPRKLAYSKGRPVANLWRVAIPRGVQGRPATWSDAQQLTFDQANTEFFDVTADGARLAFNSDRSGNMDLWTLPTSGGEMTQLTRGPGLDWFPKWSPDGDEVAFYSYRTGRREIFVMPLDGGPARQLTDGESDGVDSRYPDWSPDGNEILFTRDAERSASIHVVASDGGTPRRIHESGQNWPSAWSLDGRGLFFVENQSLWRVPAAGGEAERMTEGVDSGPIPSSDGESLFFRDSGDVWAFSLKDGSKRPLTRLTGRSGSLRADLATDGTYLYFSWQEDLGDIWVMDVNP